MKYEDNEYYHLFNRGANKPRIFFEIENYVHCLRLIEKYARVANVRVIAYCLMPNHFHLLLRQNVEGSISKFVQNTFNSYTQAVNAQQKHSGTLFQGKARGKHITSDSHALQLVRYLHLNPVEARLVRTPEQWEFSDFLVWSGSRASSLTDLSLRDAYVESGPRYSDFVTSYDGQKDVTAIHDFLFDERS